MKTILNISGCIAALLVCAGCTTFTDCVTMAGDSATDDANMPYVAQHIKTYEARMKFKKPVSITMSERAHRFLQLQQQRNRRGAGKVQLSLENRKDLLAAAEARLIQIVSNLRDFQLVGQEMTNVNTTGVTISRVDPSNKPSGPYVLTYNINNIELKNARDTTRELVNIAEIGMDLGGVSRNNKYRRAARKTQNINWFYVSVALEVNLTDPSGKNIFSFAEDVTCPDYLPSSTPSFAALKDAVNHAVSRAMAKYAIKFGPPLFVDQTVGNGLFVRLSAGSEYGIQKGHKVRFFRTVAQKYPTLPGEPEKFKLSKQLIPIFGEVGARNAPVDRDHAWVYVDGNDEPETKAVYTWTSAEIVE